MVNNILYALNWCGCCFKPNFYNAVVKFTIAHEQIVIEDIFAHFDKWHLANVEKTFFFLSFLPFSSMVFIVFIAGRMEFQHSLAFYAIFALRIAFRNNQSICLLMIIFNFLMSLFLFPNVSCLALFFFVLLLNIFDSDEKWIEKMRYVLIYRLKFIERHVTQTLDSTSSEMKWCKSRTSIWTIVQRLNLLNNTGVRLPFFLKCLLWEMNYQCYDRMQFARFIPFSITKYKNKERKK